MLLRFDTIARSADFDERASTMQLRPWQWRLLFAADGRTRLDEIARACGIEFETAADLVVETEALGLIEIVTQSLDEYRASLAVALPPPSLPPLPPLAAPMVVTFAPAPALAPAPFVESSLSVTPSVEAPVAKRVSVSFDSMSSMFADVSPVAPVATNGIVHDHDRPDVDEAPFAFEIPDHMVPLAARFPEIALPLPSESSSETATSPGADVPAKKSVSFSLFASTFGAPNPEFAEGAAPSSNGSATEPSTNGHAFGASDDTFGEPSSNGRAAYAANDVPFSEVHDTVAPVSFAYEPYATSFDAAAMHESVEAVRTQAHEPTPEIAIAPQDDVLLQHFNPPASEPHHPEASSSYEDDALKASGDLTGSLLRALGLKK